MANEFSSCDHSIEEEYIDMDMSSTTILCCRISSPNNREFEFHLSANPSHNETTISSADELFYKGKLLPLHLPYRLQMVEKLSVNYKTKYSFKTLSSITTEGETSCFSNCELSLEDYFHNYAIKSDKKKSWLKRFRIIRQSLLKATKTYFKFLFTKKWCSEESHITNQEGKSNNVAIMKRRIDGEGLADDYSRKRSLSSLPLSHLPSQTSSATSLCFTSSSSFSSKKNLPQMLKKSSNMNSEMENSILGAIAYCKMSQQVYSRKSV